MQKVDVYGDVPLARFGHTMTLGKSPRIPCQTSRLHSHTF